MIVGVSDVTTAKTIRRAKYAQQAGADAVMVLPVSYWKLTEREIFRHYQCIGDGIAIPIMAYNNPATSGVDMPRVAGPHVRQHRQRHHGQGVHR